MALNLRIMLQYSLLMFLRRTSFAFLFSKPFRFDLPIPVPPHALAA